MGCQMWSGGVVLLARVLGQQRPARGCALSALLTLAPSNPLGQTKDQQDVQNPIEEAWESMASRGSLGGWQAQGQSLRSSRMLQGSSSRQLLSF